MNRHTKTARMVSDVVVSPGWVTHVNALLLVLCAVLLVSIVVTANTFAGAQVGIATLQSDIRELREEQHHVGSLVAEREHPANIEAYATEQGMILSTDASYVAVTGEGFAGR